MLGLSELFNKKKNLKRSKKHCTHTINLIAFSVQKLKKKLISEMAV